MKEIFVNYILIFISCFSVHRNPSIDTIENCMKLCPLIVQGLWEFKSPFLQLPHIHEGNLKYFTSKKVDILLGNVHVLLLSVCIIWYHNQIIQYNSRA